MTAITNNNTAPAPFRIPADVSNLRRYVGTTLGNMVTKLHAHLLTTNKESAKEFQRILGRRQRLNTDVHKTEPALKRVYPVAIATNFQILSRILVPSEAISDKDILSGRQEDTWLNALGRALHGQVEDLFDAKEREVLSRLSEDDMKRSVYLGHLVKASEE